MTDTEAVPPTYGVPTGRLLVGVLGLPLLVTVGSVAYAVAMTDRLPDPLATHWNGSGQANGAMSLGALLTMSLTMTLVLWAIGGLGVALGRPVRVRFRAERAAMAWCCGVTSFVASVLVLTIEANVDQASWATAKLPAAMIVLLLVIGAAGAAIGWLLAGPKPDLPAHELESAAGSAPVVARDLRPGDHPVWQSHLRSTPLLALAVAFGVIGLALLPIIPFVTATFLLVAIISLPLASISVTVDGSGLSIRFGPLGWPRKHLDLAAMASVAADDIVPLEWGGWGYRVAPGRSAVVLRAGPAIVVQLRDGKQFAVTVDDAPAGAALLEAYRRRG